MKRYYSEEEIKRILKQDVQMPEIVEQRMEEAYQQIRQKRGTPMKVRGLKKYVVIAAAMTALAATSLVVLAANGFFQKEVVEEADSINYEFTLNYELSPNVFEVTPGYLPEGYTSSQNSSIKYHKNEGDKGGISIFLDNATALQWTGRSNITIEKVEKIEKTTIQGMEAHVITMKDAEKYHLFNQVLMFNPDEGYIVGVYGYYDLPIEEVKKVAEGLVIEKVEGETAVYEDPEVIKEQEDYNEEASKEEAEKIAAGIGKEEILPMGKEYRAPSFNPEDTEGFADNMTYTVKDAKIVDSIADYPEDNFYQYEEQIPSCLNADGTAREHVRINNDPETGEETESTVGTKFLVVEIQAKNYGKEVVDAWLGLPWDVLREGEDKRLRFVDPGYPIPSENWMNTEGPIYFDKPQHTEGIAGMKHFFFRDMQPDEILDYTLIYAIDEDLIDEVYLVETSNVQEANYMSVRK